MAVNGIVYPLAVRLFEQGRPSMEQIRAFKDDTRAQLSARYPDLIDDVFIERSEEHTSELQSLMRISYAVFCLKKKKNNTALTNTHQKRQDSQALSSRYI